MSLKKKMFQSSPWTIPLLYALIAVAAGLSFPRIEARMWPGLAAGVSIPTATAVYSAIASGMIALTGIVFSLTFVMVQFSATAYSPRLVFWIARDPVMSHALGIFTATFLYAIAALAGLDRSGSGRAPFISAWVVVAMLFASVAMFISLIQRIGVLQINRMLIFTGDQGREVIRTMYRSTDSTGTGGSREYRQLSPVQTLVHHGRPRAIQAVDVATLVKLAKASGGVIDLSVAVGDTAGELQPLLRVFGARQAIDERELRRGIDVGEERTFEQDPKYAIRLLVDIAIRALSPAVNDPTTAVQALDQIGDLLLWLGLSRLDIGEYHDGDGKLRLVVPSPGWEDFLRLGFDEIRFYGATSVQVTRRMTALLADLISALPDGRRAALRYWQQRLQDTITRSFVDAEEKTEASVEDRQGLGIPRRHSEGL
ncbi:MAG: DUF2254 domain-containing protein [Acidobacteriia bacterium]|nr:DUF2254 domain-containing protein [Terriglobia bacterium]